MYKKVPGTPIEAKTHSERSSLFCQIPVYNDLIKDRTTMTNIYISLALFACVCLFFRYRRYIVGPTKTRENAEQEKKGSEGEDEKDPLAAYDNIEPLHDFDWRTTEPMKLRPFKLTYHLTMGLETIPLSDLIQIDNTYASRIKLRRQIMHDHPEATLACNLEAEQAVSELYEWLMGTYLPKRYPTCFTLVEGREQEDDDDNNNNNNSSSPEIGETKHQHHKASKPTHLLNKITTETLPLAAPPSPLHALHTISSQIDTDFLILLPSPNTTKTSPSTPHPHHHPTKTRRNPPNLPPPSLRNNLPLRLQHPLQTLPPPLPNPRPSTSIRAQTLPQHGPLLRAPAARETRSPIQLDHHNNTHTLHPVRHTHAHHHRPLPIRNRSPASLSIHRRNAAALRIADAASLAGRERGVGVCVQDVHDAVGGGESRGEWGGAGAGDGGVCQGQCAGDGSL
ncbi:hypothetical protein Q7P37_003552 [Cladosporium fusiforme]